MTYPFDVTPGTGVPPGPWLDRDADEDVLAESLRRPEAFGELYARHFASVYRYVAGRLGADVADKSGSAPPWPAGSQPPRSPRS